MLSHNQYTLLFSLFLVYYWYFQNINISIYEKRIVHSLNFIDSYFIENFDATLNLSYYLGSYIKSFISYYFMLYLISAVCLILWIKKGFRFFIYLIIDFELLLLYNPIIFNVKYFNEVLCLLSILAGATFVYFPPKAEVKSPSSDNNKENSQEPIIKKENDENCRNENKVLKDDIKIE